VDEDQTRDKGKSLGFALEDGANLLMFGGKHCGVCQVVWPQLVTALSERWPSLALHYIDCEKCPESCAQQGVYSLPVIRLYFDGRLYLEKMQVFSLAPFIADINKLCEQYSMKND
jgi:hypothetical protein